MTPMMAVAAVIMRLFHTHKRKSFSVTIETKFSKEASSGIIASDVERRMPFRRVMKQAIERVEKADAKGVKVALSGRLNGADIARTETIAKGKIPLHNLRADIDYAHVMARTIYGAIGCKVWINRGEVFEKKSK